MIGVRIRILKAVLSVILSGITSAAQAPSNGPVSYIYDELGRLVAVIDGSGNAGVYSYDAVGNIVSISRYASTQVSVISFFADARRCRKLGHHLRNRIQFHDNAE